MRTKNGAKQFQKLLELMKTGQRMTVEDIYKGLTDAGLALHRLPAYLWDIGHYAGGVIKSEKNGRRVVAYTLTNPEKFKDFVLGTTAVKAPKVAVAKAAAVKKAVKPAKAAKPTKAVKPAKAKKPVKAAKKSAAAVVTPKGDNKVGEEVLRKQAVEVSKPRQLPEPKKASTERVKPAVKVTKIPEGVSGITVDADFDAMPDVPSFLDRTTGMITPEDIG